jgi:hypothetical protein
MLKMPTLLRITTPIRTQIATTIAKTNTCSQVREGRPGPVAGSGAGFAGASVAAPGGGAGDAL